MSVDSKILIDGVECAKYGANIGQSGVDLSGVLKKNNAFFYDNGLVSTAACISNITYIDGDEGVLMHRGYFIQDIVVKKTFIEVAYLILNGEFPNKSELEIFQNKLSSVQVDLDSFIKIAENAGENSHPMAICMTLLSHLAGVRAEIRKTKDNYEKCLEVIQNTLYIIAIAGCKSAGKTFNASSIGDYYTKSFVAMFLGEDMANNPFVVEILDKILTLHIDHEQNASTSTVRMVASTKCDIYGCVVAGFAALWGPLHGGANEAVLRMLEEIGDISNVPNFIEQAKSKTTKLMGFGHRVYKNYDPRAGVLKGYCASMNSALNLGNNAKFQMALELEKIALSDDYFVSRKLFPNVDFYSGIIYEALGINTKMFTCMFALSRIVGWCAHWLEASQEEGKIWRPRQVYRGKVHRTL